MACAGVVCPADSTCVADGSCAKRACEGRPACPEGQVCAADTCVDAVCVGVTCPEGASCVEGLCLDRTCGTEEPCPGQGYCLDGACTEKACVGVVCPAGSSCFGGTCAECAPGTWPPGNGDACVPVLDAGTGCSANYQCVSGECLDGACCNGPCSEPCTSCAGGSCAPLPAGAADARCQGYACLAGGRCGQGCSEDAGCVPDHRCAGGACVPRAPPGTPCATGSDCAGGFCVEGLCCDTACDAACATCSAPGQEGTCVPRPAGTPCRTATGACDADESCDGSSTSCPADGAAPDGVPCAPDVQGPWEACMLGTTCSGTGTRSRTVTTSACRSGSCVPTDATESESCTVNTAGAPCGTPTYGPWGACNYSNGCDETGTRTRTVTRYTCTASGCTQPQTTTETGSCSRDTDGTSCGTTQYGSWTACGYSSGCDETAPDRTRSVTRYACQGGTCTASTSTQRDACARNTDGDSCGTTSYGSWSTCGGYASSCDQTGVQSRRITRKACAAGTCVDSTSNETRSCSRNTDGNSCGRSGCGDRCANGACVLRCSATPGCNYC